MNQDYSDIIQELSQKLLQAITSRENDLRERVKLLDNEVAKLLRQVGREVMSMLLNQLANQVTQEAKETGLVIHRQSRVKYSVI